MPVGMNGLMSTDAFPLLSTLPYAGFTPLAFLFLPGRALSLGEELDHSRLQQLPAFEFDLLQDFWIQLDAIWKRRARQRLNNSNWTEESTSLYHLPQESFVVMVDAYPGVDAGVSLNRTSQVFETLVPSELTSHLSCDVVWELMLAIQEGQFPLSNDHNVRWQVSEQFESLVKVDCPN